MVKTCSKCKAEQPLDNFYKQSDKKSGFSSSCKSCHSTSAAKRYTRDKDLILARNRQWANENKEQRKRISSEWQKNNPEKVAAKRKRFFEKNPGIQIEYKKAYLERNPEKAKELAERSKEYLKVWRKENTELTTFYTSKRRSAKLRATPKWANMDKIKEFYLNCPDGYEVDHIVPLQGENVSGLHVLENLQYLTIEENRKKSNKLLNEKY